MFIDSHDRSDRRSPARRRVTPRATAPMPARRIGASALCVNISVHTSQTHKNVHAPPPHGGA